MIIYLDDKWQGELSLLAVKQPSEQAESGLLEQLKDIRALRVGKRAGAVKELSMHRDISTRTVYRWLFKLRIGDLHFQGDELLRKPRSDAGIPKKYTYDSSTVKQIGLLLDDPDRTQTSIAKSLGVPPHLVRRVAAGRL